MSLVAPGQQTRGTALRLIREVTLVEGPLFTSKAAVVIGSRLSMSANSAHQSLSLAARAGIVSRLKGGLYRALPPFGPPRVHEFLVATKLVEPSVISGPSALSYWGFIDQVPLRIVTASTPKRVVPPMSRGGPETVPEHSGRHGWFIEGITYVYRKVPEAEMFGITDAWLDIETQVPMFDRERAVLDTFLHPRGEGAGHLGALLIDEHLNDLDVDRLLQYAEKSRNPRVSAQTAQIVQSIQKNTSSANDL